MNSSGQENLKGPFAEGQLRGSLEKIINSIAAPVLVKDAHHRWVLVNDAACAFIGGARRELIGSIDHDHFPKPQADQFWTTDDRVLETMQEHVREEEMTDASGTVHTVLTKKNAYRDETGEAFLVVVITDITDLKQYEKALTASRQQLRNLSAHTDAVIEEERTRIAREVHDELGQSLTALKMDCAWLERRFQENQPELKARTQMMSQLIDETIDTVRRISTELRPETLDDLGLAATIEWQLSEFAQRTGIEWTTKIELNEDEVSKTISTAVYRVFLETLTNIARHARATAMSVELTADERELRMRVGDNGVGITREQVTRASSLGLLGLRERVGFLGGSVEITGAPDAGTSVEIRIPLTKPQHGGKA